MHLKSRTSLRCGAILLYPKIGLCRFVPFSKNNYFFLSDSSTIKNEPPGQMLGGCVLKVLNF